MGTTNIVRLAQEHGARLIYFQTALCYGSAPTAQPVPLEYPRQPAPSSYAISKTAGEFYIEQSGIDFVTFRLANIVGPRNLSGPLPIFYKRLTDGIRCTIAEARRDFVDVRDLSRVVLQAVDGRGQGAYHFASGGDVAILDLYKEVARSLGFEKLPEYDVPATTGGNPATILLDPSRTYQDFDMPSLTSISDTVDAAMAYYKAYGVTREVTHMKTSKNN
ncbi:GDP-L-fucose synthase [mine drainage metagenome]|uniref:GDP-L-fucose synthase n=1 Tax=mine drainage metagenome TaxID=410659 RepID=A0A1J5P991_9ZZZZ